MDATQYQGLFYLTSGCLAFVLLTLAFRLLGQSRERTEAKPGDQDATAWVDREVLKIVEIIEETHDVRTFRFVRANGHRIPKFLPGQFLSIQIGNDARSLRSYSIASSTANDTVISVAVKRLTNGHGSTWLHARTVGETVLAFPPSGHFTDAKLGNETRVFVAGGIGITPFLSMVQTAIDQGKTHRIILIYGMRSIRDLAYHGLLSVMAARHKNIEYRPMLSESVASTWDGAMGFVTAAVVTKHVGDVKDAHYFFCGPNVMTDPLMADLKARGISESHVHAEKFVSPNTIDPATIPHRDVQMTFLGKRYAYSGKMTILDALEANGVELPFACRVGVCGTCKCVVKGKVTELSDAGLTPDERRQGVKLPCVLFPEGDVELEHVS